MGVALFLEGRAPVANSELPWEKLLVSLALGPRLCVHV
jgi:hypothetical protein